ncbi:MAG: TonB-dependent receptor, partial [Thermodesulfobacteriota bacterium]|nr:TonB-dependent receptor [Thermodesulfobacteriota bacterium]
GNESALRLDFGYDYRYFETQDQNYDTEYRHRTDINEDNEYIFEDLGFYTKANYDPFEMLRLFAGIRYDTFDGESDDNINGGDTDMEEYDVWTYSGGAVLTFLDDYSIYGNVGTGFTLPIGGAKYQDNAPDEADLFHWEVGFTASPIEWMLVRYAYFQSKNDDEIRWSAGEYNYEGETLRRGHEVELSLIPVESLEFFFAYTYEKATYEENTNDGNRVPSIPKYILKLGAEYRAPFGTAFRVWYRDTGKWYTTADNEHSYEGYEVVDLKISHTIFSQWDLALDVKNLFDEDYSEYVGYWTDPFGMPDNQYAGSNGIYFQVTMKYDF